MSHFLDQGGICKKDVQKVCSKKVILATNFLNKTEFSCGEIPALFESLKHVNFSTFRRIVVMVAAIVDRPPRGGGQKHRNLTPAQAGGL